MGRKAEEFTLYQRDSGVYFVRFRHNGHRFHLSTRTRDRNVARIRAARIYAETVSGRRAPRRAETKSLKLLMGEWLASIEPPRVSKDEWNARKLRCQVHFLPYFQETDGLTTAAVEDYVAARLREVQRSTIKKELQTLRQFVKWAERRGELAEPVQLVAPPATALGTPSRPRERVDLEPWQVELILEALPERSRMNHPIKAMMTLVWETSLRIDGVQRLQCPRHFTAGANELTLTKDVDKNRWNRSLPLSDRTARYLGALCTDEKGEAIVGFIFGEYAYLKTLRATARKIRTKLELSEEACNKIDARDFRHGAASHMAEVSNDVAGIAYMMGHRDVRTSSQYIHPRLHAGRRVTQARFSGPVLGPAGVNESGDDPEDPEIISGREGIRTPDFCLRRPMHEALFPGFSAVS
jgi:integrase